jgi:hypothetical protein
MAVEHLDRCAGWVGHEWAMHIALHRVEIITRIRRVFDTLMASAHSKSNDTFARNHCAAGAMMVVSAQEAQKEQICPLDHRAVMDAVRKAIENAKFARAATRVSNDPINAVRHFLREHEQNRIVVIRGNRGLPTLDVDHFTVRMPAVYEVNVVEQKLYIDMEALERWLMKVGYAAREVMERLAKWRNPTKRSLGEGTKMRGPAIKMLAIPPIGPFKNMFVV